MSRTEPRRRRTRAAGAPPTAPPTDPSAWSDAVAAVLGLVLPVACVGCGAPDRAVCRPCRDALDAEPQRRRLVAGVRLDAAFAYRDTVRALVLELKLRGRTDLVPVLAPRFGALVGRALADVPGALLVRVPPSPAGARRRGFDPVVLLLRRAGAARGRARRAPRRALRRVRRRVPADRPGSRATTRVAHGQKERTALERVEATVGTLRAAHVAGRDVVVVDDVVTTGVTMAEAVRAVRAAGGRVVRCVALAEVEE
ncbi:phosphoribosyltransferase family protein [Curtobacterium sp. 1310]|uniref:phosphoribosyltransferase family protein n=1 Tax=Curtobacterium sp. 1310 TaxID=2806570 RepID=UPI001AE62FF7|nr:phosphoribosyltransferase family protein [Curtobacterium sp. 1310]MBP1302455.1 putative amidophosphoribosyltransferase [Curtobacterium sp. 1310]